MEIQELSLTVVICVRDGKWVAQCVEYDIAAQANTFGDVVYEFERTLNVQMAMDSEDGREPLEGLPPAPERFRELANSAFKVDTPLPRFQNPKAGRVRPRSEMRLCPS